MTDKFISDYTNDTAPLPTDELLIDKGSGTYRALSISDINKGSTTTYITANLYIVEETNGATLYFNGMPLQAWTTQGE